MPNVAITARMLRRHFAKSLGSLLGPPGNQGQLKESLAPLASVCICLLPSGSNSLALHGHGNYQESV